MKKNKTRPVRNSDNERISEKQAQKKISNGVKIPKSVKIYVRREKARIRKSGVGPEEEKKMFDELYQNLGFSRQK